MIHLLRVCPVMGVLISNDVVYSSFSAVVSMCAGYNECYWILTSVLMSWKNLLLILRALTLNWMYRFLL